MLNLTYLYQSWKNLPRSIRGPGCDASSPYSCVYRRGSVLYYDVRSYGGRGRGPLCVFYSWKTSLYSAGNGLVTNSKNYGGSPLYDGVCDIRSTLYRRNGLSCRKITYKGARQAQKRKTCLLSLYIMGRYYIQLLVVWYVPFRLALYSQQAIGRCPGRVAEDTIEF